MGCGCISACRRDLIVKGQVAPFAAARACPPGDTQRTEGSALRDVSIATGSGRLTSSGEEYVERVRQHSAVAVAVALKKLENTWEMLASEAAKSELLPVLLPAVEGRNVFSLIDAVVELERTGPPVEQNIKHLAAEASMQEEAWLVRTYILEALERANVDDIELWAEQARAAGEDVSMELSCVATMQWNSTSSSIGSSSQCCSAGSAGSVHGFPRQDVSAGNDAPPGCARPHTAPSQREAASQNGRSRWEQAPEIDLKRSASTSRAKSPREDSVRALKAHFLNAANRKTSQDDVSAGTTGTSYKSWQPQKSTSYALSAGAVPKEEPSAGAANQRFPGFWDLPRQSNNMGSSYAEGDRTPNNRSQSRQHASPKRRDGPPFPYFQNFDRPAASPNAQGPHVQHRRRAASATSHESRERACKDWERPKKERFRMSDQQANEHGSFVGTARNTVSSGSSGPKVADPPAPPPPSPPSPPPPSPPLRPHQRHGRSEYLTLLGFGVQANPSEEQLKHAYRKMAMRWHPDRHHNRDKAAEATEQFQVVKEAYDYFMEDYRRARWRREKSQTDVCS